MCSIPNYVCIIQLPKVLSAGLWQPSELQAQNPMAPKLVNSLVWSGQVSGSKEREGGGDILIDLFDVPRGVSASRLITYLLVLSTLGTYSIMSGRGEQSFSAWPPERRASNQYDSYLLVAPLILFVRSSLQKEREIRLLKIKICLACASGMAPLWECPATGG